MTPRTPWVYGIQSGEFIKVGWTRNITLRMSDLQLGNPLPLKLVIRRQCEEAVWLERRLHKLLADCSIGREWFRTDVARVRTVMTAALDDLAQRRRDQIAWEIKRGCVGAELLASWNGRGARWP